MDPWDPGLLDGMLDDVPVPNVVDEVGVLMHLPPVGAPPPVQHVDEGRAAAHSQVAPKRRAPDTDPSYGHLDVDTGELDPFFVFRAGADGALTTPRDELVRMTALCKHNLDELNALRNRQRDVIRMGLRDAVAPLLSSLVVVLKSAEQQTAALHTLVGLALLLPAEMQQVLFLHLENALLTARGSMLHRELQWFANDCPPVDGHTPNFCMLVVLEQPGCEVPFKGKPLTGHYKVCVVTGAGVAASVGAVGRAVLVGADVVPSNKPGKAGKPDVEHAEAVMDPLSKTAVFQHVVPAISTRMSPAHLVFECDVHVGDERYPYVLRSGPTDPFVVISHEGQWSDATSKLVLHNAFGGDLSRSISIPRFLNAVHLHYLRVSRQDIRAPQRQLSKVDFLYIYHRFFAASASVTAAKAAEFMAWFAPVLQALRFKKHVPAMWTQNLIFSFLDKERCNTTLTTYPIGTFLLRFSESQAGSFAAAYVSDDARERIKHYLIKAEDLAPNKSIADVCLAKSQWTQLLCHNAAAGQLACFAKEQVLAPFCTDAGPPKKQNGYENQ